MKIYMPNISRGSIGGGWTFMANFKGGIRKSGKATFVDSWQDAHIFFITGPTVVDPSEVRAARKAGQQIIFRVDNVPRKSRNKRSTPHERMKEFADLADVVVYQSKWAEMYAGPLCGEGTVIENGVDQTIFFQDQDMRADHDIYLYAYHGKSELKQFWAAHYLFQMMFRNNPKAEFWFAYDFGRNLNELIDSNFDFWNGEKYEYLGLIKTTCQMVSLMQQCKYLIFPSIVDSAPNTVLEARACGMEVIGMSDEILSGTKEMLDPDLDISLERMIEEYLALFNLSIQSLENSIEAT